MCIYPCDCHFLLSPFFCVISFFFLVSFLFAWNFSLNISFQEDLTSFSFYIFLKSLHFVFIFERCFPWFSDSRLVFWEDALKALLHCPLTCIVSNQESVVNLKFAFWIKYVFIYFSFSVFMIFLIIFGFDLLWCALVWSSLWFLCLGFIERLGSVGL